MISFLVDFFDTIPFFEANLSCLAISTRFSVKSKLLLESATKDVEKAELQAQKLVAKEARVARQALNQARKQLHRAGIEARKEERARKKMIAQLYEEGLPIPPEFEEPIPDPEAPQIESEYESQCESQYESERGSEWE
ncbi:hypothetical protein VC83_04673 [Pseudogymnoascus destructans]|uniref:Uncharacterized protein n=1 Tax=Pseudogymnoascus destructans TaxID=655981 RepID=A0A177A5A3_9PEZI|nr:uncharacterized protein VC83_04673 [Pseudogymnoascus destructans]OAF57425.1 hypothetical protein VC83_04673 [Pseudogymnoascus destructans]